MGGEADSFSSIILMAVVVTFALLAPRLEGALALIVLGVAARAYVGHVETAIAVEPISLAGQSGEELKRSLRSRMLGRLYRFALGFLLAVGFVLPFWLADGSQEVRYRPDPLNGLVPLIAAPVLWLGTPLVIFVLMARDEQGRLGLRRAIVAIWRKPLTVLAILLAFPISVAAMEALIVGSLYLADYLAGFSYDLFPLPEGGRIVTQSIFIEGRGTNYYRLENALPYYFRGLSEGATMVGSIPLSLCRGLEPRVFLFDYIDITREGYLTIRLLISVAVLTVAMSILDAQSVRLGYLAQYAPERGRSHEVQSDHRS